MTKIFKRIKNTTNKKMFRTSIALTGGRILRMAVSIVLLLIQSRYVGPETTGFVGYFSIPVGFLWILTLGIPSALAREFPYYLARGEKEKALKLAQTAQTFSVVIGLCCSLTFTFLSVRSLLLGNYLYAIGWAFQIITAFFAIYNSFIYTMYRTTDEFITIAKSNTLSAIANIVFFPLIFINPFIGLLTKLVSGVCVSNLYLHLKRPFKIKFGFDYKNFKNLFRFGLPIILIGYIEANLWTSTQSSMIVAMGGITWLGLFNFINSILVALLIIPNTISEILYPKFASVYGSSNHNLRATLKVAIKPLLFTLLFSITAMIISWIFMGDIIRSFLPKYVDAIPALNYALLILPVTCISVIKYIFVVSKNTTYNIISTLSGFLLGLGLLYWGLSSGMDFKYIFLPYVMGRFMNLLVSILLILITKDKTINKEVTN